MRRARMIPTQKFKLREIKQAFITLFKNMHKLFPLMIVALFLVSCTTIITLVGPSQIKIITDIIKDGLGSKIDINAIMGVVTLLIVLYAISALSRLLANIIMTWVTQNFTKKLRRDISRKINVLPLKYLDSHSYGDILSRITNDISIIGQTLNNSLVNLITSLVMFIGALIMMFVTNWIMAFVAVGTSLLGFFVISLIIKKSQKYFIIHQQSLGEIDGHIEETYTGHNVVKAYNAENQVTKKFEKINRKLFDSEWKSRFLSGLMMPLMNFIGYHLGYVLICMIGVYLLLSGKITFGVIVAFMIYISLFTRPLTQIAQALGMMQTTTAASMRVFDFLSQRELTDKVFKLEFKSKVNKIRERREIKKVNTLIIKSRERKLVAFKHKALDPTKVQGNVKFENVKFGYNRNRVIISDFSADIKAGQKIAIVGPTGAGKTTLVNLLMRFYEIWSGRISIDGLSTKDMTRGNVHALFSMVLQDPWIFSGTIFENIAYNSKNVTRDQVIEVCKSVDIDHFIRTLPNGYDTIVDDNSDISEGQKQLISIARAMIKNSPMLILDEATSSVDTRTEVLIQRAMDKIMQNRTSFIIAHRLSTIKNADLILVIRDGNIVESGKHKELLAKDGFYATLYNSQFENG